MDDKENDDDRIWQIGVFDSHCHPTDIMASVKDFADMKARVLTVMATRSQDQEMVEKTARMYPTHSSQDPSNAPSRYVVPAFGWHPWFSHQLFDDRDKQSQPDPVAHYKSVLVPAPEDEDFLRTLPAPYSLQEFLQRTEARLIEFPFALVGEVGLDRSFRLPEGPSAMTGDVSSKTGGSEGEYTPGSREGRPLTPYRVNLDHQKTVLRAQLEVAAKLRRPVSVHSVQAHGLVFDLMQSMWKGHEKPSKRERKKKADTTNAHAADQSINEPDIEQSLPFPPRICMHSYSGPPDALKQFLNHAVPADIYFSFSTAINFSGTSSAKTISVIKAVPDDRILIESDLHCAGETMDKLLQEIVHKVCEIKEWSLEDGAQKLKRNWIKFVFG
ncbi:Cut9-interacting protein scn1 [Exophiala xenobiotica]|jgi:Tat protein secretion system quality control protein TatD with DNase activity